MKNDGRQVPWPLGPSRSLVSSQSIDYRRLFQINSHPENWGNDPIWRTIFNWVEPQSVNQELRWFRPFEESFWIFKCKCQPPKNDGWKTLFLLGRPIFTSFLTNWDGHLHLSVSFFLAWWCFFLHTANLIFISFIEQKIANKIESVLRMFGFKKSFLFFITSVLLQNSALPKRSPQQKLIVLPFFGSTGEKHIQLLS